MKPIALTLIGLLSFGSVTNIVTPEAKAQDYRCFSQYNNLIVIQENLTRTERLIANSLGRQSKDAKDTYILFTSVKKKFTSCLNYSNDFVGFTKGITRNGKYIYTAKNTAIYLNYDNTKAPFLMYKRLILTFEPQKNAPAIITVSSVPIPPPVGP
jgi:hypothetical protein